MAWVSGAGAPLVSVVWGGESVHASSALPAATLCPSKARQSWWTRWRVDRLVRQDTTLQVPYGALLEWQKAHRKSKKAE